MNFTDTIIKNISKIAFLFIVFAVIAGGVVQHILSCQMQKYLRDSEGAKHIVCLLYTSPSPRDLSTSRMPSSA